MPARIDYQRACVGTRSFAYVSINQWRTDTGRQRPAITCAKDFVAGMSLSHNGLGRYEHVEAGRGRFVPVAEPAST